MQTDGNRLHFNAIKRLSILKASLNINNLLYGATRNYKLPGRKLFLRKLVAYLVVKSLAF
jgi:hypothetical protein